MISYNHCVFVGNVGREPEVRTTTDGTQVTQFSLAVDTYTGKDLLLQEITAKMMDLEESIGKPIAWVAAVHDDHTDKRHVHVLAIADVWKLPAVEMRQRATAACPEQRRELDRAWEHKKEQERGDMGREWERER